MKIYCYTHATYNAEDDALCDTSFKLINSGEPVCLSPEYIQRIKEYQELIDEAENVFVSSCVEVTTNLIAARVNYELAYGKNKKSARTA